MEYTTPDILSEVADTYFGIFRSPIGMSKNNWLVCNKKHISHLESQKNHLRLKYYPKTQIKPRYSSGKQVYQSWNGLETGTVLYLWIYWHLL